MVESADTRSGMAGRAVSRRTIVKGAAWTVPAIVLATAAPAAATISGSFAASGLTAVAASNSGTADVVTFTISFSGTSTGAHTVTINSVTGTGGVTYSNISPTSFSVVSGGSITFTAVANGAKPKKTTATVNYGVSPSGGAPHPATAAISATVT